MMLPQLLNLEARLVFCNFFQTTIKGPKFQKQMLSQFTTKEIQKPNRAVKALKCKSMFKP